MNQISYDLAKRLNDAGLEQNGDGHVIFPDGHIEPAGSGFDGAMYVPTLSELIEACGDRIDTIGRYRKKWFATGKKSRTHYIATTGHFDTPEIAVAQLWLALNKK